MFQFEKLLQSNGIAENDPELPRSIEKQIQKLRNKQKTITSETTPEEKEKIEDEMDAIDDAIMKTLPEFFDIEDEEEENKKKQIAESAKKEEEKKRLAKEKEENQAKEAKEKAELNTPATNDDDALDKLFRKGKTTVTISDLKSAGFNTGFFGDLTPSGCVTKRYKLICSDGSQQYNLIKK